MDDKRINLLKNEPIPKAVMFMAIPSTIGMLVMAFYNMIDTMFVSWIGTEAAGATQIVFPITLLLSAIGLSLGIGGGSYISRLLGKDNYEDASKVCSTSFFLSIIIGFLTVCTGLLFLEPILYFFGATDTIIDYALDYGKYMLIGGFFTIINMTLNNLLRAEGSSKITMISMVTGSVLNILLDPLFIFTFGWGIKGAAIATTISQFTSTCILLTNYFAKKTLLHINIKEVTFEKIFIIELCKVGAPTFFRQMLLSVSMGLLNNAAGLLGGDVALASVGIVSKLTTIVKNVIFGLTQGFQPVIGYNYGANQHKRVVKSILFTIFICMSFAITAAFVVITFDDFFLGIYRPTPEVMALAKVYLRCFMAAIIMFGFTNVISVMYQSTGKGLAALILSVSRQGIFFIPIIFILPRYFGLNGVFISQTIADIFTLILSLIMFVPTLRHHVHLAKESST